MSVFCFKSILISVMIGSMFMYTHAFWGQVSGIYEINGIHAHTYVLVIKSYIVYLFDNYIILDGLEGDTRIYCQRC